MSPSVSRTTQRLGSSPHTVPAAAYRSSHARLSIVSPCSSYSVRARPAAAVPRGPDLGVHLAERDAPVPVRHALVDGLDRSPSGKGRIRRPGRGRSRPGALLPPVARTSGRLPSNARGAVCSTSIGAQGRGAR
ncbi:hypothetical protein GCM10010420_35410 [Streptomyces glaucosporus]|uniref:Uncharacterized protein n=1 Tax=Streptomyces glaucosporus TaxID=284044 RepID=A0ABP5VJ54_9ACTN